MFEIEIPFTTEEEDFILAYAAAHGLIVEQLIKDSLFAAIGKQKGKGYKSIQELFADYDGEYEAKDIELDSPLCPVFFNRMDEDTHFLHGGINK